MGLITCPKCGARVIDTSSGCTKCGAFLGENGVSMTLSCNCTHPSTVEVKNVKIDLFSIFRKKKANSN